ncbi:IS4 family transposase [Sporosarcina ureae]|uniref:IS4 family transposase n=1 Tax=Sporosarcina ureae TaxID=1571 RepID=UPI0028AB46C5|nr:transposase [Sporosarcina ureae]
MTRLTDKDRPKVLIIDDSAYDRNRSKKVELLARCFDHASLKMRFYKGFRMLTLGWSDGHTFLPIDFPCSVQKSLKLIAFLKISKNALAAINVERIRFSQPLNRLPDMIRRALANEVEASYVLMDSWFTLPPLVKAIVKQGLDVIGMVKKTKQRYLVNGKPVSLKQLYQLAVESKKGILRSIDTVMKNGTPVKIVFIQNRNKRSEWLAILSTDCSLAEQEIVRIYGMRWDIEAFFKTAESLLRLEKEFQNRSFDVLISHTIIVFARYIVLTWQNRCHTDQRTLGGLFYELCDEENKLDWAIALQQLIGLLEDARKQTNSKIKKLIQSQLERRIAALPSYIKAYLPISVCES